MFLSPSGHLFLLTLVDVLLVAVQRDKFIKILAVSGVILHQIKYIHKP